MAEIEKAEVSFKELCNDVAGSLNLYPEDVMSVLITAQDIAAGYLVQANEEMSVSVFLTEGIKIHSSFVPMHVVGDDPATMYPVNEHLKYDLDITQNSLDEWDQHWRDARLYEELIKQSQIETDSNLEGV